MRGAGGSTSSAFCAGVGIHQVFPRKIKNILCAKRLRLRLCITVSCGQLRLKHILNLLFHILHIDHFSFWNKTLIVGIGESQQNMKMLAVRKIIQEGKNACNMQPPAGSLNANKSGWIYTYQK